MLTPRRQVLLAIASAVALLALLSAPGRAATKPLPTSAPSDYTLVAACNARLGALWAPRSAFDPATGNEPPLLGFHQGKLVAMVFYLSEKHLYPLMRGGGMWAFSGAVNAPAASVTIAPAEFRPHRDKKAYELIVMVQQEPAVTVTCEQADTSDQKKGEGKKGGKKKNQ